MTDIILEILLRIVEQILIHFVKKCIDQLFAKRNLSKKRAKKSRRFLRKSRNH
ncbi:hypothetical protein MK370_07315 [Streptococcus sanguinis]|uniref:hypothetical protein n=1 Tax=Streptococcus sanguinis TaxID=1305 RepID=UPI0022845F7C|nr:hypothetical protein [Streptococcus sanguinis]MCY7041345.1 hypothetical protein [Streptococcus sanguinis]